MKTKILLLILIILTLTAPILVARENYTQKTPVLIAQSKEEMLPVREVIEAKRIDPRAKILADYFKKYNSPFENHAQDFIDAADFYGVDWKLVPSIAGVESTFGKHSYGYNAWGWGIYGDNRLNFNSWRDGIFTVTGGLKENYIDKGLTDPYSMNRVYAASPTWGAKVTYFMNDLTEFEQSYPVQTEITLYQIAGTSAQPK